MTDSPRGAGPIFALFAKPAVVGEVKTRLAPPLTDAEATLVYEAMLADTAGVLAGLGRQWAVVSTDPERQAAGWPADCPRPRLWRPQTGRDLGERMRRAVEDLCGAGYGPVILVGSDHPNIPSEFLERAVVLLESRDVVLGPTFDGGYYLIGMNRVHPVLFEGLPWSTSWVFRNTVDRIRASALTAGFLPPWYDVDRAADLCFLRDHLDAVALAEGADRTPCPRTRAVLKRLRLDRPGN